MARSSNWNGIPKAIIHDEHKLQRNVFLEFFESAISGDESIVDTALIVSKLVYVLDYIPPRWKDLLPREKFRFELIAGHNLGINFALTFNISDQQRTDWISKHSNLARGFHNEILRNVRHIIGNKPLYWFVVEPKVSKGKSANTYEDKPGDPRRFDIHAGFFVEDGVMQRFQKAILKRAEELKLKKPRKKKTLLPVRTKIPNKYPLYLRGRMAHGTSIRDEGWGRYSSKAIELTRSIHFDVVGKNPTGRAIALKDHAERIYSEVRRLAEATDLSDTTKDFLENLRIGSERKIKRTPNDEYLACRKFLDWAIDRIDPAITTPFEINLLNELSKASEQKIIGWAIDEARKAALYKV